MKILVFEDSDFKHDQIVDVINNVISDATTSRASTFNEFHRNYLTDNFDLVIVDLIAPQFRGESPKDLTSQIIETVSQPRGKGKNIIALTQYDEKAEGHFKDLNQANITVITFSQDRNEWKDSLADKITACIPPITFDFIVLCALKKEAEGFIKAGYEVGEVKNIHSLECREITISDKKGVIICLPRMGLVSCAITSTLSIELFSPKLICMSGICAGIDGKANIYDVIIPDVCHQHDLGKWSEKGFESEIYGVPLYPDMRINISAAIQDQRFTQEITYKHFKRSELPLNTETPEIKILLASASSGSAVIANQERTEEIKAQHRKNTAFEMESYALYESARLSRLKPNYFSAKVVVDDGTSNKSDAFHEPACIISAKTVYNLILRGIGL